MTEEKQKDQKEKNRQRMLFALSILMIPDFEEKNNTKIDLDEIKTFDDMPEPIKKRSIEVYKEENLADKIEVPERIPEETIVKESANVGNKQQGITVYKITTAGDDKVCKECQKWQGVLVTMDPTPGYKTVDDFIQSKGLHPNCRCALIPEDTNAIDLRPPNPRASAVTKLIYPEAYNSESDTILVFN